MADMSSPICRRSSPIEAILSRSSTISACGWSIFVSMIGGKANIPLAVAFSCNWRAKSRMTWGSAVEAMTNSTGKFPPPGKAGGTTAKRLIPGMVASLAETSGRISLGVRSRSPQDLRTMPAKPDDGWVI